MDRATRYGLYVPVTTIGWQRHWSATKGNVARLADGWRAPSECRLSSPPRWWQTASFTSPCKALLNDRD